MNFLLRPAQSAAAEEPSAHESPADLNYKTKPAATLEGLIAEDPYPQYSTVVDRNGGSVGVEGEFGSVGGQSAESESSSVVKHSDVSEEEGCITIPCGMPSQLESVLCIFVFQSYDPHADIYMNFVYIVASDVHFV